MKKTKLIKLLIFLTWLLVMFLPHSIEAAEPVEAPEYTFTALDGTEVSANGKLCDCWYCHFSNSMFASAEFLVTIQDRKTKKAQVYFYTLYRMSKN